MANIEVVVFASPNRELAHSRTFPSIEASDIGKGYKLSMHPDGMDKDEHWRKTHELAARAETEFVVVLEDDVFVNRHILENVETWRWKSHPDTGAGWLYNAGGYSTRDTWYRGKRPWAMTPGVVYRTSALPRLIEIAMAEMKKGVPWDCAMAWAVTDGGKRIRVHYPSLIEHQNDVPSKLGNPSQSVLRTSRGTFSETWRRPAGDEHAYIDRFGRTRSYGT
jgi:hypothetical protein